MNRAWVVATGLFVATVASTLYVGTGWALGHGPTSPAELVHGVPFALPLMTILLAHELGHWLVARAHGIAMPPPYFLPMPFGPFGTLGAVIDAPERYPSRRAMLDVAMGGPIAGLLVAMIVLVVGLSQSVVEPLPSDTRGLVLEGRSLVYVLVRDALVGPIPAGSDVMLSPTALAGWTGLLLTMMNLAPVFPLDGGQVLRGLVGDRYVRLSRSAHLGLAGVGGVVALALSGLALHEGVSTEDAFVRGLGGAHWLAWAGLVALVRGLAAPDAPGYERDLAPSPAKRALGLAVLALFPVLFMPWWMRAAP